MLVTESADRAEGRGGESDFSGEDAPGGNQSPASIFMSPPISPSPPPPPPPVSTRWSDFGRNFSNPHRRVQATNSGLSYSESDSCPQCRERYAAIRRNNSIQSAATLNSYTSSSQPRKEACRNARLQRMPAEDDDSCPVILDRDFHSLHRNVPALRRRDVDTTAIRQHYYPEGGWGWIICGAGFIVHLFTTGLQLSFGLLYLHTLHHIGNQALMDTVALTMEACTLPLRVKLPKYINKSEFLGCNLNPVVVLTDIRKSLKRKETGLETPPTSPEDDQKKAEPEPITTNAARQKSSKGQPRKKNEVSTLPETNSALSNPKRFKSMKRKRESWDPSVEYEIEEILGYHRDKRNRMLYLVKWKNWSSDHNTFEPIGNLTGCHYELMRYFETRPPTAEEIVRKNAELDAGLSRRSAYERLRKGGCKTEDLAELLRECPDALKVLEARDLNELEERAWEECDYIVRCLIGMRYHQDPGLVLRGQNYKLLLKLIQLRRKQLQNMAAFEEEINNLEKTRIAIENKVDLEEFPSMDYIVELKPGAGVVLPKEPLLGCECTEGCNSRSRCCGKLGDSVFAYGSDGRLRTSEKVAIYECNSRCRCPKSCPNRVVQRGRQVKLCIFKTKSCGWGVKALERIPKGTFVCEYVGELIPEEEANARDLKCVAENKSSYLFNLDFFTDDSLPMYCIDAGKQGNVARFINHSCDPNLVVYPVWVDVLEPNLHRLAFFARRNIQKDEEIQFDYESLGEFANDKADDENAEDRLRCQCSAANCRKWVFRNS